ncbi:MAG: cupin domain-containing protein [Candidatus Melainabacteria bacterium]|nr:cupin domain-containing protein [Candidatus Melainabacteria bacterium]
MILKELRIVPTKGKTKQDLERELIEEGFSCYSWSDSPGAYYPPHNHAHDECICVISGKMSFIIDNKEYELESGKKLYLPAGTVHESKNKFSEKVVYLIGEMSS